MKGVALANSCVSVKGVALANTSVSAKGVGLAKSSVSVMIAEGVKVASVVGVWLPVAVAVGV